MNAAIPAPALPAMTPELLAALRAWCEEWNPNQVLASRKRLYEAIVSAPGILPPPAPSPPGGTDVQATLQWEWLL